MSYRPHTFQSQARFDAWRKEEVHFASTIVERSLLRILETTNDADIDRADLVQLLSLEFTPGMQRRQLMHLSSLLSRGESLGQSLLSTPNLVDPSTAFVLKLGEEEGKLPSVLQALTRSKDVGSQRLMDSADDGSGSVLLRSSSSIFAMSLILIGLTIFIVPTISKIFEEFELELPAPALLLIVLAQYVPYLLLAWLAFYFIFFVIHSSMMLQSLWASYSPLKWTTRVAPVYARLLSLLAIAHDSGSPDSVQQTLQALGRSPAVPNYLRKRLIRAVSKSSTGHNLVQALYEERILSRQEAKALGMTEDCSAQSWLLRWFARVRWQKSRYWTAVLAHTASTLVTVVLGCFITLAALGVVSAIYTLIMSLE